MDRSVQTNHGEIFREHTPARVSICAATFRRPEGLQRLLDGLAQLQCPHNQLDVTIIIVDNDPAGSAREIVDAQQDTSPWLITYIHESRQGTPFARNAALDAVPDDADFVCFIDDDESPDPDWLIRLVEVQQKESADVVTGPVVAHYEDGVPIWVQRGKFFNRSRFATGTVRPFAFTNNVLFRAKLIRNPKRRFDTQFLSGVGEDQAFFQEISHDGNRIVWADDAVVHEWIPVRRARAGWLILRMYDIGRSMTAATVQIQGGIGTRFVQFAKGLVWVVIGVCTLPCGILARRWAVRSLRWLMYGFGLLRGLI